MSYLRGLNKAKLPHPPSVDIIRVKFRLIDTPPASWGKVQSVEIFSKCSVATPALLYHKGLTCFVPFDCTT